MKKTHGKRSLEQWTLTTDKCALERLELAYNEWLGKTTEKSAICKKHSVDSRNFNAFLIKCGHDIRNCDDTIFDTIDTEEKAYWLGFLYADGYVASNRSTVELTLKLSDLEHVTKFKIFLKGKNKIVVNSFKARFAVGNKILRESLIKNGCGPLKSHNIKFPTHISDDLIRHFVRGYFDGDGSITRSIKDALWHCCSIGCGSPEFLQALLEYLVTNNILETRQKVHKSHSSNCSLIVFNGPLFIKFCNWLYQDANVYLERKFIRYNNSIAVLFGDK